MTQTYPTPTPKKIAYNTAVINDFILRIQLIGEKKSSPANTRKIVLTLQRLIDHEAKIRATEGAEAIDPKASELVAELKIKIDMIYLEGELNRTPNA